MRHDKISEHMREAIEMIRARGGAVFAEGGGWWQDAHNVRFYYSDGLALSTGTIYALEKRGILKRTGIWREKWRDTRVLVETE